MLSMEAREVLGANIVEGLLGYVKTLQGIFVLIMIKPETIVSLATVSLSVRKNLDLI